MTAGIYNITVEAHADFSRQFQIKETIGQTTTPLDLTGHTLSASIRERSQSDTSVDFTVTIDDASDGKFTLSLTDTQTAGLKVQDQEYDVVMTKPDSTRVRLLQGIATVSAGITR